MTIKKDTKQANKKSLSKGKKTDMDNIENLKKFLIQRITLERESKRKEKEIMQNVMA